ncbi:hypothetical protein PE066_15495 [Ramlibacter tataouinensis]|uniref:hypothetical protein n=1 Tax=Ramlibacter tataouinensis TaxID=94132 RepID=UPI0022F3B527|nr:hypothetical protein [Ramlibacter tataouinensis]WBY00855.1 hypothetical protein PE066_15495 [Ramlibacter tataouinensis]
MRQPSDLGTLRAVVAAADFGSIGAAGEHRQLAVAAASLRITALQASPLTAVPLSAPWAHRRHPIATQSDAPLAPAAATLFRALTRRAAAGRPSGAAAFAIRESRLRPASLPRAADGSYTARQPAPSPSGSAPPPVPSATSLSACPG